MKDFLEKLNWITVLGIIVAVEMQIGNGSMSIAKTFPASWVPAIQEQMGNLGSIGALIMSAGAFGRPAGSPMMIPPIMKILLIGFALSFLLTGNAHAQSRPKLTGNIAADIAAATTKPGVALTGNIQQDLQALWQKIVTSSLADLNYAAAMAASANTTTSAIRLQCVKAIIQLNEQASGANLKNADGTPMVKPDPHLFSDVESLAEIIDNLSPQGPLFVSCAGAAQLAKTNVLTFVNGVVTGVAGFAAMPVIPGL